VSAAPGGLPEIGHGPWHRTARRTDARAVSARSLLLTVLGEFVLPRRAPVWTAALLDALQALDVEPTAGRQALARATSEGFLEAERVGRRTRWSLSRSGVHLLEDGTRRIYGFLRDRPAWDGRWLVLAVTVPQTQRQLRHRLRTRLSWAGLGSPAPGLWVVPDAGRAGEVARIVRELGIEHACTAWTGEAAGIGDVRDVVAAAWSLTEVQAGYQAFVERFTHRPVSTPVDAFVAQVELVHAWRRFPFLDPGLPPELLDHDWPGQRAAEHFHRCHDRWHDGAQAHWSTLCAAAADRT
jgi:phenylacetic acid degradation operon negative regulatory protein